MSLDRYLNILKGHVDSSLASPPLGLDTAEVPELDRQQNVKYIIYYRYPPENTLCNTGPTVARPKPTLYPRPL